MDPSDTFEALLAEGSQVPLDGWDFSWFEGRATEERPSWGYAGLVARGLGRAASALDVQTGGGEVLATALAAGTRVPATLAATESWPPNLALAHQRLGPYGAEVVQVADGDLLPFPDATFDLVTSRHPTVVIWPEIARVLRPGGTYLSQQVGAGSNQELIDAMMGSQPVNQQRSAVRARRGAEAAGLDLDDLREESLRVTFDDVGAVTHFLRKVLWTVPDFTPEGYREPLARLHRQIREDGPFVCHSRRMLVVARKPA